jgi:hypothetical protein
MRLGKVVVWLALAGAPLLSALSGCGGAVNVGETHVGKEELFKTGNFNYDEFFEDVYGLQGSAKKAVDDEKAARVPLGQALGVGETSMDRLLEVLKGKADELAQSKNRVHFAIDGLDDQAKPAAGKQITVTSTAAKGRTVPKDATDLGSAIEQTAKSEGQVWEKYGPMPEKARHLGERADTLQTSVSTEFESAKKDQREEVYRELKAAKTVAAEIAERCDKVAGNATKFFKQGSDLLTAAANAEIKPPAKGQKGKPPKSTPPAASKPKDASPPKDKPATVAKPSAPPSDAKPAAPKPAAPAAEPGGDFNP